MDEKAGHHEFPIESLLSARLLLSPQLADGKVYFMSDMSGVMSLYRTDEGGSIPEPLLPRGLAIQNPHLMDGYNYVVLPKLRKILVMIDEDGNENYQPSFIPLEGGIPKPIFGDKYKNEKIVCSGCDIKRNIAYFSRDDRKTSNLECLMVDLANLEMTSLGTSIYGNDYVSANDDNSTVILGDSYTSGDNVLYIWRRDMKERELLFGVPLEKREKDQQVKPLGIMGHCNFTPDERGLLFRSAIFRNEASPSYLRLEDSPKVQEVAVEGLKHSGAGVLVDVRSVEGNQFLLEYIIEGCSWLYECTLHEDEARRWLEVNRVLCGLPPLAEGTLIGSEFEVHEGSGETGIGYVLSFATAKSPSQIFLYSPDSSEPKMLSKERVLGIDSELLSEGEDASYNSFDGLRISARLYRPSEKMGFEGPRPLILYVHGGPHGQERPDFTWFSMPLIQFLTLNGFSVFVPNVRGSTGYGLEYMKQVDHDWGGKDMLDHVEGLKILEKDSRIDSSRRAVIGRSYGGYMTLMLASKYPELWKAACDMFGPYDLIGFMNRLPESWRTFFYLSVGHPDRDRAFLVERSPKTYLKNVKCAMLILQGRNDPRVLAAESEEIAEQLRKNGVKTEFMVFEDEGHDVMKFKNKVICYTKIVDFFRSNLGS